MSRRLAGLLVFVLSCSASFGQEIKPNPPILPRAPAQTESRPAKVAPAPAMPAADNDEFTDKGYVVEVKLLEGPGLHDALEAVDAVGGSDSPDPAAFLPASPALPGTSTAHALVAAKHDPSKPTDWAQRLWDHEDLHLWDVHSGRASEITLLSAPKIALLANQNATVQMTGARTFTYLEPLGNGTFEAKHTEAIELGIRLSLGVRPFGDDPQIVELSPLDLAMSVFEGREPVEGLDLDVGKPIIHEKVLKPSAVRVKLGEVFALASLGNPKSQVAMLVRVTRPEKNPPGPAAPTTKPQPTGRK